MDKRRVRKIIRIDMDAFYASFQQVDNPDLKRWFVLAGAKREVSEFAAFNGRDVSWRSSRIFRDHAASVEPLSLRGAINGR